MRETQAVFATFTCTCRTCGAEIHVIDGVEQPHRCRVEITPRAIEHNRKESE